MLPITIPANEQFDPRTGFFYDIPETTLHLEHSLATISKWESKWKKPFISREPKTVNETVDYVRCMVQDEGYDPNVFLALTPDIIDRVNAYIEDSMTATTFRKENSRPNREIVTSELIYYWMVALQIPFECEHWHLNRLIALIQICSIKNSPGKKMSKREILARNRALNAARRRSMKTSG